MSRRPWRWLMSPSSDCRGRASRRASKPRSRCRASCGSARSGSTTPAASASIPIRLAASARRVSDARACATPWRKCRSGNSPGCASTRREHPAAACDARDMEHQRKPNVFVGNPVERIEDLRFLRGRGQYVDDLTRAGLLHAVILRSSVAHGRIRSIDASAARTRPGVHAVITAAEIGDPVPLIPMRQEPLPALKQYLQPVIAQGKVRYVGEPLAVVVAESAAIAEDALEAIEVMIEPLPAVADRDAAREDEVLLFESAGTNVASVITAVLGDADAAFRTAPYVRRERFKVQRHAAVPMEPRGLLAEWDAEQHRLTVSGAAKVAFANRRTLARMLALTEQSVPMLHYDVRGAFGPP